MPIPALDKNGFLPPGVHDCTLEEIKLEEIKGRFGAFQQSDRRPQLFARLGAFLSEAKACGLVISLVVDGSFVTAKPEPNDIDLIVVVAPGHSFDADLSPGEYAILSKRRVHRRHGFDLLVAGEDSEEYRRYAAECLRVAQGTTISADKSLMLEMAQKWCELAEKAERNESEENRSSDSK